MAAAVAIDASSMVAAVCSWHERHAAVAGEIGRRLDEGASLVVPAHALVEAYAVLTRLPPPHRLAPRDAWALLKTNFADPAAIVAIDGAAHATLLARLAAAGVAGGRTYDGLIVEQVAHSRARTLVTLNPRHFEPPPPGVAVVEPR